MGPRARGKLQSFSNQFSFRSSFALFSHAGLDMVVRDDNGNILDINQTSTTQLYEQHVSAANRIRRATVSVKTNF